MSIVSSTIIEDRPQIDGRRHICERHTDHTGRVHDIRYMAATADNVNTFMANRVATLESQLANGELNDNEARATEGPFVAPTLVHCTAGQVRTRIRELFRVATAWQVCRLAWYIQRLGLTDNQLKAVFGVNDAQLVGLKAKLTSLEAKYNDVSDEVGQ